MEAAATEFFEANLDVIGELSLQSLCEEIGELHEIEHCFTEGHELSQALSDLDFGIFNEDVIMKGATARKEKQRQLKEIKKRTGGVMKNTLKTYGNITKVGGNLIFAAYSMVTKLVDMVVRVVKAVSEKLVFLPNAIGKFADNVAKLPEKVMSKIKGHLTIHIRAETIKTLYTENLFVICDDIINNALVLADGDAWVTRIANFQLSDVQLAKRMLKYHSKLAEVQFIEETINMNDTANVAKYFGSQPSITITSNGSTKSYTYFQALQKVAEDIKQKQKNIRRISEVLDKKLAGTQSSQTFGRLPEKKQQLIKESVRAVADSILLLEKLGKVIMQDINTMHKFIQEVINNTKKTPHRDEIRKNIDANKDAFEIHTPKDPDMPKPKNAKERRAWRKMRREQRKADVTKGPIRGRYDYDNWEDYS